MQRPQIKKQQDTKSTQSPSAPKLRPTQDAGQDSGTSALREVLSHDTPGSSESARSVKKTANRAWLALTAAAGIAVLGLTFIGGDDASNTGNTVTGEETLSSTIQPGQIVPQPTLGAADIDQQLTQEARETATTGEPIPGLPDADGDMRQKIVDGKVTFYTVRFFDTHDVDGDQIRVTVNGVDNQGGFLLDNAGTIITIPVVQGSPPPNVILHAVADGTGGVTVGVQTSTGIWLSNRLPVGGSQTVPFVAR